MMNPYLLLGNTTANKSSMTLKNGSRIAIIGGGPAGSLFSYFLLDLAGRLNVDLSVDIYEPRDFSLPAPQGCNMCAGVASETLIQNLATEGINLPNSVVQKAINSYILHTDLGIQRLKSASNERRIAAIYRGGGPRGIRELNVLGLDAHLLSMARAKGANLIRYRVSGVERADGCLQVKSRDHNSEIYDLLVVASGVNSGALNLFEEEGSKRIPPKTTKTSIREYYLGKETVDAYFGDSLHVFLLDIPKLDFAMIVPKGEYVSVCILGKDIDADLLRRFLTAREVKSCFPEDWRWDQPDCQCSPRINIRAAKKPYGDRVVFIGDSGVSRLKKDGIGAAYRAAKAAATCAILEGISADDFRHYYAPFCGRMELDNHFGRLIFFITHSVQRLRFLRRAMILMAASEQRSPGIKPRMSNVLWDTFTGSAPFHDVFLRALHPSFICRYVWFIVNSVLFEY